MTYRIIIYFLLLAFTIENNCDAQTATPDTTSYMVIAAGPEYKKRSFYQWLWGKNRRVEWMTPIRVPVLWLDTIYGGLKPYRMGGGNETRSLRLRSAEGKEYALRSINKSRNDVVPPEVKGTFIEGIIQDGVSMSYPYGAFPLREMQKSAGIYYTEPKLFYVPRQAALDSFNERIGNDLYMLEQRPDEDWSEAVNLGNFSKFSSTEKLIGKLLKEYGHKADQKAFATARLFDMLVADWDRHEDNYRWGVKDSGDTRYYSPIPRDRDQAFYTHNGLVIDRVLKLTDLGFMQNFTHKMSDARMLNLQQRHVDRFFTNTLTLADWESAAKHLQQTITDDVIARSVQGLPPEVYAISGKELEEKLISRRGQLAAFAKEYYLFLAETVEVTGTKERDYFEVKQTPSGETSVSVYPIEKDETKATTAAYTRNFSPKETDEIRLYGINGEDLFAIEDKSSSIKVRVIGGPAKDSIVQTTGGKIHIYDNYDNSINTTNARLHLSTDSAIHDYNYSGYNYNITHIIPYLFFNDVDIWLVGINYQFLRHKWRRQPYAHRRTIGINYSGSKRAIGATFSALYPNAIGKWNISLLANYDGINWTNFFGTGNETVLTTTNRVFHRMRSTEWTGRVGIGRNVGMSSLMFSGLYQQVKILNDEDRFIGKIAQPSIAFQPNHYAGGQITYTFLSVNDSVVPTKGISFIANAGSHRNITRSDFFQTYDTRVQVYLPFSKKLSLAVVAGGKAIEGNTSGSNNPQILQHAVIGGPENIRGFRADRFWGKTAFYNKNELRFITDYKSRLINTKVGLVAFVDNGRVWMPGEKSNTLHTSYGGGLFLAPFYKISGTITYGISKEMSLIQVGINTLF